jgi:hypothetical protein
VLDFRRWAFLVVVILSGAKNLRGEGFSVQVSGFREEK